MFANTQMMGVDNPFPRVDLTPPAGFPNTMGYLYHSFPNVMNSSGIVTNMQMYGNLDEQAFRNALTPGLPPFVGIAPPAPTYFGPLYTHNLGTVGSTAVGPILLDPGLVKSFEVNPKAEENMCRNSLGQKFPMLGAVLLYCICNWGVYVTTGQKLSGPGSPGKQFEKATYGRQVKVMLLAP